MSDCPCKGEYAVRWHDRHGIPRCDASRLRRSIRLNNQRAGVPPWIPGSQILVDEIEEL